MIRDATPEDLEAVADMSVEFSKYTPFNVPGCRDSMLAVAEHCLQEGLLFVCETDGTVVGFIAGIQAPLLMNQSYSMVSEVAWWMNPEHRHGRNGMGLKKKLEQAAKARGAHFCVMAFLETSMPDQIKAIYKKEGYSPGESYFLKEL